MTTGKRFIKRYEAGFMPWVHEQPDFNLVEMVQNWPIAPGRVLELGCGTGTDAIWLAENGFDVTAVDVSEIAVKLAAENAGKANAGCQFLKLDFWYDKPGNGPFDFVFDRGYFHSHKTDRSRRRIAKKVASQLKPDGLWLSLIGSCDSPPRDSGPPMHAATEIVKGVEPYFEILLLKASVFGGGRKNPAKNWVCLMRKRDL